MKKVIGSILVFALAGVLLSGCDDSKYFPELTTTTVTQTTTSSTTTTTMGTVAAPVFSPSPGDIESDGLTVTITSATDGATIYYSVANASASGVSAMASVSAAGSAEVYLSTSSTITAYAVKSGMIDSPAATGTFNIYGWAPLGSGMNVEVHCLAPGSVYAGGEFTSAGGVAVSKVAKWTGTTWEAVGSSISGGDVWDMSRDSSGNIWVTGNFVIPNARVARWNGSAWSSLGTGLNGSGNAIAANDTDVYVGGYFSLAGGVADTAYIARWNKAGSTWHALGEGANTYVYGLAINGNYLYAAGYFSSVSSVPGTDHVARWDMVHSTWEALGSGVDGTCYDFAFDAAGNVYVAGVFTNAGGVPANNVVRWTGTTWEALGSGLNDNCNSLAIGPDGLLYAGGRFTTAGGVPANYVAKWDGSSWLPLGSGTVGYVNDLVFDSAGTLYAGGEFLVAGGQTVNYIAKWKVKK